MIWVLASWSTLILAQALAGVTRFKEFRQALGITPTTLTRRLNSLVEKGVMERRLYLERPPREEYVLTEIGLAFRPVIEAMTKWSDRHAKQPLRNNPAQVRGRAAARSRHRPASGMSSVDPL